MTCFQWTGPSARASTLDPPVEHLPILWYSPNGESPHRLRDGLVAGLAIGFDGALLPFEIVVQLLGLFFTFVRRAGINDDLLPVPRTV